VWNVNQVPYDDFVQEFKAKIAANIRLMYRYAYFLCRDRELAQDITHDACVNIFKSAKAIAALANSGPVNIEAYAIRAVGNAFNDYLRAPLKRTGRSEAGLPDDEGHRVFRVADPAETTVTSLDLQNALLQLDDDDRALIYFRYYEGRGIAEAVEMATGLTGGETFRRHKKVLERLRQLLTGNLEENEY